LYQETKLDFHSHFADLGSGCGNVVVELSLKTGCSSFGIEKVEEAAALASVFIEQAQLLAEAHNLQIGHMRAVQGDFLAHPEVPLQIAKADVILVNNLVFNPDTSERLTEIIVQNMKQDARIYTLSRLTPGRTTTNEINEFRYANSPGRLLHVEEKIFPPDSVIWTHSGGFYYVHTLI
ncbi:S-adenosyl-L-methionine-dependent methyltransferase, partial [Hymenopellis radicata]